MGATRNIGEVETRASVENSAILLNQPDKLHLAQILRALEHHVFEQMRKTGSILGFDSEANSVVDRRDDGGRRVIRREDDPQTVRKRVIGNGHSELAGMFRLRQQQEAGSNQHGQEKKRSS